MAHDLRCAWKASPPDAAVEDTVRFLARAVIAQACREWRSGRYVYVKEQSRPETVAGELLEFFKSPVFVVWCDIADIDADYLRERLGVSECK